MRRSLTALGAVLAACSTITVAAAPGAAAAGSPVTHASITGYFVVAKVDATGAVAEAVLFCGTTQHFSGPTQVVGYGSVNNPTAACQELVGVDSDITKLHVHPTWLVPATQAPVNAYVWGGWYTRGSVSYQHTFRNNSEGLKNLGDVFDF